MIFVTRATARRHVAEAHRGPNPTQPISPTAGTTSGSGVPASAAALPTAATANFTAPSSPTAGTALGSGVPASAAALHRRHR